MALFGRWLVVVFHRSVTTTIMLGCPLHVRFAQRNLVNKKANDGISRYANNIDTSVRTERTKMRLGWGEQDGPSNVYLFTFDVLLQNVLK